MRRPLLNRPVNVLGQSMPVAAIALLVFVVLGSALVVFLTRNGIPALQLTTLAPSIVLRGQLWRVLTWAFFETDGQNLVFGALMLGVFGRELAGYWGGARYLAVCAGVAVSAGVVTTLIGMGWSDVGLRAYLSIWPIADSLAVAWSLLFPTRTILFMFVLPIAGRNLMYLTVGITALFAIMYGFSNFVPHFLAMAFMYLYVRGGSAIATELRLKTLFTPKRDKRGLRAVDDDWRGGKKPQGSGWVH